MAYPTILVDSTDGAASDTACSGAGPSTALTGSGNGEFTSTTEFKVPNESFTGVATDGSHVLFTQGGSSQTRRFHKITAVNNAGTASASVTVAEAGVVEAGLDWAIGGVRATVFGSQSVLLLANSGAGDAMPGWTIEMQSGHTESKSGLLSITRAGNATDGGITLQGAPGAATPPVVTQSDSTGDNWFAISGGAWRIANFEFYTTAAGGRRNGYYGEEITIENVFFNGFNRPVYMTGSGSAVLFCEFQCGSDAAYSDGVIDIGRSNGESIRVIGNVIVDRTDSFGTPSMITVTPERGRHVIAHNVVHNCTGTGIYVYSGTGTRNFCGPLIYGNVVNDCTGDGIHVAGDDRSIQGLTIIGNIISRSGGYGINLPAASAAERSYNRVITEYNAYYNNSSGSTSWNAVGANDIVVSTGDPLVDQANDDLGADETTNEGQLLRDAVLSRPQGLLANNIYPLRYSSDPPAGGGATVYLRGSNALLRR